MDLINLFNELKEKASSIFSFYIENISELTNFKGDKILVTKIDLEISKAFSEIFKNSQFKDFFYFSEEEHSELHFPNLCIDPIDGTIELSKKIPECAVSVAIMKTPSLYSKENFYWLYNPFTKMEIHSGLCLKREDSSFHFGFVSRSEYNSGLFVGKEREVRAVGSIAYKLMLLSLGLCDYVVTLKDKWIWDIAGGSLLLNSKNIYLFDERGEIKLLNQKLIHGPLIWCKREDYEALKKKFLIG